MLATERDQKLIRLLGDYELFSTRQILETTFPQIEKRTALRRLRKLEKEKWIRRAPGLPGGEAVWALGPVGAHKLRLDSYLEKINRNTVEHDVALNDVRMEFEHMGLATDWITEQAMRRKQDKRHGDLVGQEINPDAIFVVDVANEPKAVALEAKKLSDIARACHQKLAFKYQVRALDFAHDIDNIIKLEKSIHAADKTSRVNFDTAASIGSMKNYYRRISTDRGAFVLSNSGTLIGIVGFMKSLRETRATRISSVGLDLSIQGKGLFFPFLHEAFLMSKFKDSKALTGVTTTSRLIAASEKYEADVIGYLLSRNLGTQD